MEEVQFSVGNLVELLSGDPYHWGAKDFTFEDVFGVVKAVTSQHVSLELRLKDGGKVVGLADTLAGEDNYWPFLNSDVRLLPAGIVLVHDDD